MVARSQNATRALLKGLRRKALPVAAPPAGSYIEPRQQGRDAGAGAPERRTARPETKL